MYVVKQKKFIFNIIKMALNLFKIIINPVKPFCYHVNLMKMNKKSGHLLLAPISIRINNNYDGGLSLRFYSKQKYQSDSESDSDLEVLGHRGETQFWRQKIRTFHNILDVNRDGVLSFDDFQLLADRFVNLGHLSDKHTKEFRLIVNDLWEKRWGNITPYVNVELFLIDMHHILNDKKLVRKAHSFLPYLFKAVDNDHNGEITIDEFKLFFQCLDLNDDDALIAFKSIDTNHDGKITIKEFIKQGREFFVNEDETHLSKNFWGPLIKH